MSLQLSMHSTRSVTLDSAPLTVSEVEAVARRGVQVRLSPSAATRVRRSRAVVDEALTDGQPHYGINTGFGSLSRTRVNSENLRELQRNLVRSHAAGIGDPLPTDVTRAMMLLLAASLSRGFSGVRSAVIERILQMLNTGQVPLVPSVGSVGASGDLAPLAHVALAMIGEGDTSSTSRHSSSRHQRLTLEAKEGLAIINGTHLMAARGALLCADFERLFNAALVACAMSIDAARATDAFLDPRIHKARRQHGQILVADRLRQLLRGSTILPSHAENDPRVQDPYSLRCAPQVLGAAWDAFQYCKQVIEQELGAVTDNPLVFHGGASGSRSDRNSIVSAGNFHGMPLAIALDTLAIAITHVAGISERRVFWLLSAFDPESHLSPYLAPGKPGLQSGLMIAQYTAAACVNEIVGLAAPASVANIPTSAGIEDYNSFGPRSCAKAARALDLARYVVATELLCAAEGLERHRLLRSGNGVERAHAKIRRRVKRLTSDRPPGPDVERIATMIAASEFEH